MASSGRTLPGRILSGKTRVVVDNRGIPVFFEDQVDQTLYCKSIFPNPSRSEPHQTMRSLFIGLYQLGANAMNTNTQDHPEIRRSLLQANQTLQSFPVAAAGIQPPSEEVHCSLLFFYNQLSLQQFSNHTQFQHARLLVIMKAALDCLTLSQIQSLVSKIPNNVSMMTISKQSMIKFPNDSEIHETALGDIISFYLIHSPRFKDLKLSLPANQATGLFTDQIQEIANVLFSSNTPLLNKVQVKQICFSGESQILRNGSSEWSEEEDGENFHDEQKAENPSQRPSLTSSLCLKMICYCGDNNALGYSFLAIGILSGIAAWATVSVPLALMSVGGGALGAGLLLGGYFFSNPERAAASSTRASSHESTWRHFHIGNKQR